MSTTLSPVPESRSPQGATAGSPGATAGSSSSVRATVEKLALYGGPKAVSASYKERWRRVRRRDALKILAYGLRDINTLFIGGPVARFEEDFARLTVTRYALCMNSGTAALHSAFYAVGVGPGDEVIVPSYTFYASAAPIIQCGGWPIFCDVDPRTLTADPDDVERRITPRTKAICVVHLWGNPARIDRFVEIAKRHKVALIEDCSHAHGATFQGRPIGTWGDVGCFSLQGTKAVSGGELGIAVTNNPVYFDHMLALGHYLRNGAESLTDTYDIGPICLGVKYRPHIYGVLLAQGGLKRLDELNRRRQRNYDILREELADCPAVQSIEEYPDARRGGFLEFILRFRGDLAGGWNRGAFVQAAVAEGVPIIVDRYKPLHTEPLFATADLSHCGGAIGAGYRAVAERRRPVPDSDLPVTTQICRETVSLPPFTKVSEAFVRQCAKALKKVAANAAAMRDYRRGE